jgi:hypothetical protein
MRLLETASKQFKYTLIGSSPGSWQRIATKATRLQQSDAALGKLLLLENHWERGNALTVNVGKYG